MMTKKIACLIIAPLLLLTGCAGINTKQKDIEEIVTTVEAWPENPEENSTEDFYALMLEAKTSTEPDPEAGFNPDITHGFKNRETFIVNTEEVTIDNEEGTATAQIEYLPTVNYNDQPLLTFKLKQENDSWLVSDIVEKYGDDGSFEYTLVLLDIIEIGKVQNKDKTETTE